MNFFETVRSLNEATHYSAEAHGARLAGDAAHAASHDAFFHGETHAQAAAAHKDTAAKHRNLAKQAEATPGGFAALRDYHNQMADHHEKLSALHTFAE